MKLPETLTGLWKNQRGSTLELKEHNGELNGYFTTAVTQTKSCIGVPVVIQGVTNKNVSSISLSMESCGSPVVIAMTTVMMKDKDGKEQLKAQALVQRNGEETWNSQILSTEYYTRVSPEKTK